MRLLSAMNAWKAGREMFDCKKFHDRCKASCCYNVPIPKKIWDRNLEKIVTQPIRVIPQGYDLDPADRTKKDFLLPETADGRCPFLREDYLCNIHEDRPPVCRKYGDESHVCMKCPMQDKDGNARSRQGMRQLGREQQKWAMTTLKRISPENKSKAFLEVAQDAGLLPAPP